MGSKTTELNLHGEHLHKSDYTLAASVLHWCSFEREIFHFHMFKYKAH